MNSTAIFAAIAMGVFATSVTADDAPRYFQISDMHRLKDVGAPDLSPDGKDIVYSLSITDLEADAFRSDIWRVAYAGGAPVNLTDTPEKSEWSASFSPDGKSIGFLSEGEEGNTQFFLMKRDGSGVRQVSQFDGSIMSYGWAPDSQQVVFTAFVGGAKPNAAGTPAPIVVDRFQFKEDNVGYLASQRRHLHILDIATGTSQQITSGDVDHWLPSWSPDGQWIAYVSKVRGDADRNMDSDIFIMKPEMGGATRDISQSTDMDLDPYWATPPAWSPDSQKLAWLAAGEDKWIYYEPWQITVADLTTGEVNPLGHIDRIFFGPQWSSDGHSLFTLIEQDRATWLAQVDAATGAITYLDQGDRFTLGFDVEMNGRAVVQRSDDNHPPELFVLHEKRQLTHHNAWLNEIKLAKTERFDFKSDGHDIGGLIVYPPDYKAGAPYPAVFRLHGGPVYQFSHEFMYDWQVMAAQGYIVVGINPRGSSGKGFDFAKAIYADWGNVDSQDILAGARYLAAKGLVDIDRLGLGGWSYGGMLTDYVIATEPLFSAAVSGAGNANMYGSYGHDQYSREYELEVGTPWDNPDAYARVSFPFLNARKIETPTLFQCAMADFNVPCLGSEQMYQALRSTGVETGLILYPNQNHGITVPSYLKDRMTRILDWYTRHLGEGINH